MILEFILERMLLFKDKFDGRVLQKALGRSFLEGCSAYGSPEPCPPQKAGDQEAVLGSIPVGNLTVMKA